MPLVPPSNAAADTDTALLPSSIQQYSVVSKLTGDEPVVETIVPFGISTFATAFCVSEKYTVPLAFTASFRCKPLSCAW